MPVQRYKLTIAYRGSLYHGWQHQAANPNTWKGEFPPDGQGIPTIQETVTTALKSIVGHHLSLVGSSRTDAGVHAKGQVAHFDTDQLQIPPEGMRRAANARLPEDILIRSIEPVPSTFDAILSTHSKRYQYQIWNAPNRPLFFHDLTWHRWQTLDTAEMTRAAPLLEGQHDFASFARPGHGRENTVRTILECRVRVRGPRIIVGVTGTGFLWNMVRIITGTLVDIGLGHFKADDIPAILAAKDRKAAGGTAPPHGLFLQWIKFKETNVVGAPPVSAQPSLP